MATALQTLIDQQERAREYSENGFRTVKNEYGMEAISARIDAALKKVIG